MTSFLDRYQQGEYEEVWADLLALGEQVRTEPVYADALAVARETMRRARFNIETLIPRLRACGYQFGYGWVTEQQGYAADLVATVAHLETQRPRVPWSPPPPDIQEQLAYLEQLIGGLLPLSLRAWYEVVGQVNFVGELPTRWGFTPGTAGDRQALDEFLTHSPFLHFDQPVGFGPEGDPWMKAFFKHIHLLDPLYVLPFDEALDGAWSHPPRFVSIAPDFATKYWESGVLYRIAVPNGAIDAKLEVEWHGLTFVEYLRLCFRWAGLPELAYFAKEQGKEELSALTEGLLPL